MLRQGMDSGTAIIRSTANQKPPSRPLNQSEAGCVAHHKCGAHRCDGEDRGRPLLFKFTENKLEK